MKSLKGTKTEKNLMAAFAGESQARNRYTYFASKAKEEGYFQISLIFEETANQEKEHAKRMFKFMEGGEVAVSAGFPFGVIGSTRDNLLAAAAGENHEWKTMYPDYRQDRPRGGLRGDRRRSSTPSSSPSGSTRSATRSSRPTSMRARYSSPTRSAVWRCLNCGYLFEGMEPPKACPACAHPQAYFELLGENW